MLRQSANLGSNMKLIFGTDIFPRLRLQLLIMIRRGQATGGTLPGPAILALECIVYGTHPNISLPLATAGKLQTPKMGGKSWGMCCSHVNHCLRPTRHALQCAGMKPWSCVGYSQYAGLLECKVRQTTRSRNIILYPLPLTLTCCLNTRDHRDILSLQSDRHVKRI